MPKRKQIDVVGHLLNILWTVIGFAPLLVYWVKRGMDEWLFIFVFLGVAAACMPNEALHRLQLFQNKKPYEKLGVKTFRKFVQEGDHSWLLKTGPVRTMNLFKSQHYLRKVDMYQRFHTFCLVFFLFSSCHCFYHGQVALGLCITTANVIYNMPTLLLQDYNRLRITGLINRKKNN